MKRTVLLSLIRSFFCSYDRSDEFNKQYVDCKHLYSKKNYTEVLKLLNEYADCGNPMAKRLLGICYNKGQGIEKDEEKAKQLYEEAFNSLKELAGKNILKYNEF